MSSLLYRIGRGSARHPWRVIAGWVVALVTVTTLAGAYGGVLTDDYTLPGSGTQRANDLLRDRFPAMSGTDSRVVVHSETGALDKAELSDAAESLGGMRGVSSVGPPALSTAGDTAVLSVQYDIPVTDFTGNEGIDALVEATAELREAGLQVELGGQVPENVQAPSGRAELVGLAAAIIILLLAFGAVVAAGLPLAVALVGLGTGTAGITLLAAFTDVSTVTPTLATMVGLGVGIDYALFIVTRHRDGLAAGLAVDEAAGRANATAGQSVVFAGGTVLLSITGLQFSGVPNFAMMGYGTGLGVLVTVVAAVTLLPALLGLMKLKVYSRKDRRAGRLESTASHSRASARLAETVGRRPVTWLVASLAVLIALAAPALGMRIGQSDAGSEPTDTTVRKAYDLVAEGFGPGANGPFLVAADLTGLSPDELPSLRGDIAAQPGVAAVSQPVTSPDGSAAVLTVTPTTGPQDVRTTELLHALRADVLPEGVEITGFTASMADLSQVLSEHLWLVILVVISTSLLLLMVAFRSLVVPLKAALVNLLSVGAAFGVMTLLFQTDTGARLLGLPGEVPIAAYVPVLMFAILFGLSMDYEVFLLSRVREEYHRTNDARSSVVTGLAATARVITSAALIMVAVFLGFALDPSVVIKMIGVGMAVAIALDATIVRLVLVPATMSLLGSANWYLPRWLDRLLPQLTLHAPAAGPAATGTPQRGDDLVRV